MAEIQSGMIVLWSGSIFSIPTGYTLCDGNNDTPDLTDRFIMGAGDSYAVGAQGGSINHTHDFTSDGHDHLLPAGGDLDGGGFINDTTTIETDTGTTDPASTLPPYYALAYIMKI